MLQSAAAPPSMRERILAFVAQRGAGEFTLFEVKDACGPRTGGLSKRLSDLVDDGLVVRTGMATYRAASENAPAKVESSLVRERVAQLVAAGISRADEIDYRCRHAPFGMRFPTPAVRAALAYLVQKGVLLVDESGPTTTYRIAVEREQPQHLPEHARGTYRPPVAPPRRPNSDWRQFPSRIGSELVPYRPHV